MSHLKKLNHPEYMIQRGLMSIFTAPVDLNDCAGVLKAFRCYSGVIIQNIGVHNVDNWSGGSEFLGASQGD